MRLGIAILAAVPLWAAATDEIREQMRQTVKLLEVDDETLNRFHFLRRREVREMDSEGKLKSKRSVTHRREPYEEVAVLKVVARDDKPLSDEESRQQEESIRYHVAQFRIQREAERSTGAKSEPKKKNTEKELLREFPEALNCKAAGEEMRNGRATLVYEFSPRQGYKAKNLKLRFFEKTRGKAWIDKATRQLVEVDAEMYDTVNVGFGVVGRMEKGTRFRMVRREAAPGLWVPDSQKIRFAAKILLFKTLNQEVDLKYTEFTLRPEPAKVTAAAQ